MERTLRFSRQRHNRPPISGRSAMERRGRRRLPWSTPVRVFATPGRASESFLLESSDVSEEGVFLRSDLLFAVGEELDLEFVVPGRATPVRGRGRVVRVEKSVDGQGPGMAVHVADLSNEDRQILSAVEHAQVRVTPQ